MYINEHTHDKVKASFDDPEDMQIRKRELDLILAAAEEMDEETNMEHEEEKEKKIIIMMMSLRNIQKLMKKPTLPCSRA